jgi:Uma2 family endonuclease
MPTLLSDHDELNDTRATREVEQLEGPCSFWQRDWTEEEFQILDQSQEPRFFEFTDGQVDFLGWPTLIHQSICAEIGFPLHHLLRDHKLGEMVFAVCPVRLRPGRWVSPDIAFELDAKFARQSQNDYFHGADGIMEILSNDDPEWRHLDLVTKRREYAQAGVSEYWIVDPETETITVLTLPAGQTEYAVHGEFKPGQTATSKLLDGFTVDVTACFAAGKGNS